MEANQTAAYQAIEQAQLALKQGNKHTARQFAEQAAQLAPELEDVWVMMAALASPHASVEYLNKALQINPQSQRAQKGMAWAVERLRKEQAQEALQAAQPTSLPALVKTEPTAEPVPAPIVEKASQTQPTRLSAPIKTEPASEPVSTPVAEKPSTPLQVSRPVSRPVAERPSTPLQASRPLPVSKPKTPVKPAAQQQKPVTRNRTAYIILFAALFCVFASIFVVIQATPASALFNSNADSGPAWAQADLSKSNEIASPLPTEAPTETPIPAAVETETPTLPPTETLTATASFTPTASFTHTPTNTATATITDTPLPTDTPSITPTEGPSPTPLPTDTALPTVVIPTRAAYATPVYNSNPGTGGARWIDVNLSQQMVYAYEGNTLINSFVVSTGTWQYPTVTGQYSVYIKYRYKDMSGPGYYLPNVPYTMFFYRGYAIHGTYWHSNFGTPMSHGCVNLTIPDSAWLYNFASVGTLVNVHY